MAKTKSDTITEEVRVIALGEIVPPKHLKLLKREQPFWDAIIAARAKSTWTDIDLCHAVNLAACLSDIARLQKQLSKMDIDADLARGQRLLDTMIKRSISLSKMLHIHASATQGRARDTGERTKREKGLLDSLPDNDLLAKPIVQ